MFLVWAGWSMGSGGDPLVSFVVNGTMEFLLVFGLCSFLPLVVSSFLAVSC